MYLSFTQKEFVKSGFLQRKKEKKKHTHITNINLNK